jgi:hypothetical protein
VTPRSLPLAAGGAAGMGLFQTILKSACLFFKNIGKHMSRRFPPNVHNPFFQKKQGLCKDARCKEMNQLLTKGVGADAQAVQSAQL